MFIAFYDARLSSTLQTSVHLGHGGKPSVVVTCTFSVSFINNGLWGKIQASKFEVEFLCACNIRAIDVLLTPL